MAEDESAVDAALRRVAAVAEAQPQSGGGSAAESAVFHLKIKGCKTSWLLHSSGKLDQLQGAALPADVRPNVTLTYANCATFFKLARGELKGTYRDIR